MRKIVGLVLSFILLINANTFAQKYLMDMVDTTKDVGKGILGVYKKYDRLKIGGYIQPQFQVASEKGAKSFEGGDFGSQVSNRYMIKRSRVRIDYINFNVDKGPGVQIVFQFDANERGFTMRDVWGRIFENKYKLFSFTTGMFSRPFGNEVNYSSSDRESPERGRMSQILMKSERDLGAMISFDARKKLGINFLNNIKMDLGLFNGQGINATGEFDNTKDLISRIYTKPLHLSKNVQLNLGASLLYGGLLQNTKYKYQTVLNKGVPTMMVDSSNTNLYSVAPRQYYGVEAQLKIKNHVGFSEFRAEYVKGKQTGTSASSETPSLLLTGTDGFHIRNFDGAYLYYVQHLGSLKHQLVVKYDWYDPNTKVSGTDIGATGANLGAANIKYSTLGVGYVNYLTENIKMVFYVDKVWNEITQLKGYTTDISDDIFTIRVQYRF
ncbi:MAG: hypothetical protein RLZZ196_479 [Bacteroidota bacterium]|jgi:hypothetical protein